MMEQLEISDALPDFDNLDVNLDGSAGFELETSDFDAILGGSGTDGIKVDDVDLDNLMNEAIPGDNQMSDSGLVDHLKTMPIAEVDQADEILGFEQPQKEDQFDFEPQPLQQQSQPDSQWGQPGQANDPLLGTLRREPQPSNSIQMIVDQGIDGVAQNGMLPPVGQNNPTVENLQSEKQKLLERLSEINRREEHASAAAMGQNRGFVLQRNEHVPQTAPQSNNMFLQDPSPFSAPVASVGGLGSGGETPLQSFLRAGRKSQGVAHQQPRVGASMLSQNVAGAPKAASIFSQLPGGLEAITSQSELQASNSFLDQSQPQTKLFASMDRSVVSQEMVRKLSSRSLARQGAARGSSGNVGNASWGIDAPRKSGFRTSGILSKHASETHLLRKGGVSLSKSKVGSLSRENALYSMMKRNSSKNLIRRDDSHGQLLPTKRRGGSKIKLSLSRSVPALMANNGGSMSQGSHNAVW